MRKLFSITLCATALFVVSCSTELEVNGPYKDIPVVYGILNQNDSVHYVKVNRAFLGQGNAYDMAAIRDSSEYGDVLTVEVNEMDHPQNLDRKFTLERVLVTNKSTTNEYGLPGDFYAPEQHVYKFSTGATPLHGDARYSVTVTNNQTGKIVTGETEMVNDFVVSKPSGGLDLVSFATVSAPSDYNIQWRSAEDGKRYSVAMTMTYLEVNKSTLDTIEKSLTWGLGEVKSSGLEGNQPLDRLVRSQEFFRKIQDNIPVLDGTSWRYLYKMDFVFWVAGEELNTYMEVNEPSTGIIQDKPTYTNLENGIGIFGSRYYKTVNNKYFSRNTADLLSDSPNAHPEYGERFTHWYGQGAGQTFQFLDLH